MDKRYINKGISSVSTMYAKGYQLNIVSDIACLVVGFYEGAMKAKGVHVDFNVLLPLAVNATMLRSFIGMKAAQNHNKDPFFYMDSPNHDQKLSVSKEGMEHFFVGAVLNPLEIAVGFAVGYGLGKLL